MLNYFKRTFGGNSVLGWLVTVFFCMLILLSLASLPGISFYVPNPFSVLKTLRSQGDVFIKHFISTSTSAIFGFSCGSIAAIMSSLMAIILPSTRRGLSLISVVLYSIPLIAAAPLSALIFGTNNSGAVLGCIGAYLPIYLSGLRAGDRASKYFTDMVRAYGASHWQEIKVIRLPLVIRGWLIGAQSGWIWAVLGALLGDFTGGRWGLGTFLVGALSRGEPSRVWAIILLCLILSAAGLVLILLVGSFLGLQSSTDPLESLPPVVQTVESKIYKNVLNFWHVVIFLILWQVLSWILNIDGGVLAGPIDMIILVVEMFQGKAAFSVGFLFNAFCITWGLSIVGVIIALIIAFIVVVNQHFAPILSRPIVLGILITQVTPIVAFVPMIAFYFGRDNTSVIAIVISSTIYPAYTVFFNAIEGAPKSAAEMLRGFGGGIIAEFIKIRMPYAAWMAIVAIRLSIGRALLGAITGEYLLTGNGVGGILGQTRALLDFRVVWFVCTIVALLTLAFDSIISVIEKNVRVELSN